MSKPRTAAAKRARANRRIHKLSRKMKKLVRQSLVYEPGEIVMIPGGSQGQVLMEIIEKAEEYGEYRVRLIAEDRIITQSARYFEAPYA